LLGLFAIYLGVAMCLDLVFYATRLFERQELSTINRRFEARQWLTWNPESLKRLNLPLLWDYHERHEFPRVWYHWDWTLSWLVENNHPPVANHIVIFNRTLEDEPPDEAIKQFPWMEPLRQYPLPRKTTAQMIDLLAASGASAIILDNDFPQHADGDADIAAVIHKWSNGVNGRKVPIFMVGTVNSGSDSHVVELGVPSRPVGVLSELSKLEPGVDVDAKYLGTTCVSQDPDQVVRGIFLTREVGGKEYPSIILKVLQALGRPIPKDLPDPRMDIDFGCPPKSEVYPVRPLTYLLDPQLKEVLSKGTAGGDVNVKNAIVFVGDGITDIYSTPFTNDGNNQMSGTEILAHALETVSRKSWPIRLTRTETLLYCLVISVLGALLWMTWKAWQVAAIARNKRRGTPGLRLLEDLGVCAVTLAFVYFMPCFIFDSTRLLLPMFVPTIALAFGTLAAIVLEREQERAERFQLELKAAQEKLTLTEEKYEADLKTREAEAKTREMLLDKKRRHEFVRRINHDLNAPVSVLNWTVSELQMMELQDQQAKEKVARLVKSSDKLCELIDQLVQSYDYESVPSVTSSARIVCDLVEVVHDSVDGQLPLATVHGDQLIWTKPEQPLFVLANELELSRVVDNIIRNAIKHNAEGTKVTVAIESSGTFHTISISDNGKGIAPEHLEKIFQPGFRVEGNTKDGQGLGLDIAKTLIEAMGGEIAVTSTLKKGTTFKLKIPSTAPGEAMFTDLDGHHEYVRAHARVLADGSLEITTKREGNGKSNGSGE
jgi:signal transduction histidine kinase